jgi:monoamine oxidase
MEASKKLGYGSVIKLLIEFKEQFWSPEELKKRLDLKLPHLGFIMSKQEIPTWWTQYPQKSNLLTGWLAGPNAEKIKNESDDIILEKGLQSLGVIFKLELDWLKSNMKNGKIFNWSADPFTKGAYAYRAINSEDAIKLLSTPIDNTIFFAGEALDTGDSMGTVEAALLNAIAVVEKIKHE